MYQSNTGFTGIDQAVKFVKEELQKGIDKNNELVLDIEKIQEKSTLLHDQEAILNTRCQDLAGEVAQLEQKRETIKAEVKEYAEKTTTRLEKERSDFESVRIKERSRLVSWEDSLNIQKEELDQREIAQSESDKGLKEREGSVDANIERINLTDQQIAKREAEISTKTTELSNKDQELKTKEADLSNREELINNRDDQSTKHQKQVEDLVRLSEQRMAKIETVDKQQELREVSLNTKEAGLIKLGRVLDIQKIQLDDRSATQATH